MSTETVAETLPKKLMTAYVPLDLAEAIRKQVFEERGTISALVERAVRAELQRADRKKATK